MAVDIYLFLQLTFVQIPLLAQPYVGDRPVPRQGRPRVSRAGVGEPRWLPEGVQGLEKGRGGLPGGGDT